jgi:hypothetical protein
MAAIHFDLDGRRSARQPDRDLVVSINAPGRWLRLVNVAAMYWLGVTPQMRLKWRYRGSGQKKPRSAAATAARFPAPAMTWRSTAGRKGNGREHAHLLAKHGGEAKQREFDGQRLKV